MTDPPKDYRVHPDISAFAGNVLGHRIGYIRVSTFDQNPERQLENISTDKVFIDKASGKDIQRPQLDALPSFVREDDTVVVHSMDRLARNLDDLQDLVEDLTILLCWQGTKKLQNLFCDIKLQHGGRPR